MRDDVEIEYGGVGTVLGIETEGVQLATFLPDHLDSVTVRRALLEGADRIAETAITDPSINATDDVQLDEPDELQEAPRALADGGLTLEGPEINIGREGDRWIAQYSIDTPAGPIRFTTDPAESIPTALRVLADRLEAVHPERPSGGIIEVPEDREELDVEAVVDELEELESDLEDAPINQAGDGIQEEP